MFLIGFLITIFLMYSRNAWNSVVEVGKHRELLNAKFSVGSGFAISDATAQRFRSVIGL